MDRPWDHSLNCPPSERSRSPGLAEMPSERTFLYFGWVVPRGSPAPTTLLLMMSVESADTTGALRLDPAPVLSHARGARAARQAETWVETTSGAAALLGVTINGHTELGE